jgi:predicted Zn-dependent protease
MQLANELQVKYELTNDKELNKLKEQLRAKISTQECINAQKEITALFNSGMQKKSSNQLLEASNDFNNALDISRQFNNCGIDVTQIESNELEIRPAATYLGMMRDFKDKEYKRQFSDCISIYNNATNYFNTRNIASFGINHEPDYYTYVSSNGSNGLMQYAAETYTSQNELEKALTLFKLLLAKNVDDKIIEGSLYELGFKFGKREALNNPGSKAKNLVKQYTSDDKNLKRFEKGFAKGYND